MNLKIFEQENALFERWQKKRGYDTFIYDGVICPEQWEKEHKKIVFVLKEANAEGETLDWRECLSDSEQSRNWGATWNNVARWAKAILECGEYMEYVSPEERSKWLCRVSVMNLKKIAGGATTKHKELVEYAQNDARFIWEQLCIYNPDIIIACGSWVDWLLWEEVLLTRQPTDEYVREELFGRYYRTRFPNKDTDTIVICWRHPNGRYNSRELYNKMAYLSQNICNMPKKNEY